MLEKSRVETLLSTLCKITYKCDLNCYIYMMKVRLFDILKFVFGFLKLASFFFYFLRKFNWFGGRLP